MVIALVILALAIGVFALLGSSQAASGAAGVGFACLLGIFARLVQAEKQHRELLRKIQEQRQGTVPQ